MNRISVPLLSCLGAFTLLTAQARLFEPQAIPPKLSADAETVALYEFRQAEFEKNQVPDTTGKNGPGEVKGTWVYVPFEELHPAYQGAGKTAPEGRTPSNVTFPAIADLKSGPFTVDVYLRWDRSAGNFVKAGGAVLGIQHGGPGSLQLKVPVIGEDGKLTMESFMGDDFYKTTPVPRQADFRVYSLTFDGAKTFQVFLDGEPIFTATLPEGKTAAMSDAFALGDVETWKRAVVGLEIAAARISRGVRKFTPQTAAAAFPQGKRAAFAFDAGTAQSPVEKGTIPLTSTDLYDAKKGYGWLGTIVGDYDEPLMPDRYANNPETAIKSNSYRFVDAINRDGVVLEPGQFFRVDVPDGQYWVAVEFGHNRDVAILDTVTANGTTIGEKLASSSSSYLSQPNTRTARGLVTASGGKGITIEAAVSDKSKVPVREIVVVPYEPLPIVCDKAALIWKGKGPAPAQLPAITTALKAGDFPAAVAEAEKITDPFLQANALECILGVPHLPTDADLVTADKVRQLLLKVLREQPANAQARWLFDSSERYRYTVTGYLQNATDVIPGTRFDLWARVPNFGLQLRPEDPGVWQARFLAGGGLWQQGIQSSAFDMNGTTDAYVEKKSARLKGYPAPGGLFREVIAAYPDFRLAKIMLGEKLTAESTFQPPASAPEWASPQYQLLQRILDVAHYWVNERMNDKGFLGGGIGDDVEVMRWWTPGVVVADDATVIDGWNRMATGVWNSTGKVGYSTTMDDVEHSSEPTSDPLPMLYLMNYGTPKAAEAMKMITATTPIFRDIWSATTPDGLRYFKGYHFSATEIERPGDVPYNIRAIKPLLWASWGDPKNTELRDLMVAYAKNWREATMTESDGKPRGIVPMMIKPDRKTFREPEATSWMLPGYASYDYPTGNSGKVYDLMLAGYEMSGDPAFLEPIKFGLDALRAVPANDRDPTKYPVGSLDWAVRIGSTNIVIGGTNYRLITGDKSYDDVLSQMGPPYVRFLIASEKSGGSLTDATLAPLIASLKKDLTTMNTNPELRTTLIQSTDRIYVSGTLVVTAMATGATTTAAGYTKPDDDLRGGEIVWPTFQITWRGTGGQVAILVTSANPDHLDVQLYNFADQPKTLKPAVWRLHAGAYELVLSETDKTGKVLKELSRKPVTIEGPGQQVEFEIPSQTNVKLSFAQKK